MLLFCSSNIAKQIWEIFTNRNEKEHGLFGAKPLAPSPPRRQVLAQHAAHVIQTVLFTTGWHYRLPGEVNKLFRRTLYRKNTHK